MKIRMVTCAASPELGVLYPKHEYELEDEVAVRFLEAGAAVPVRAAEVERAVAPPAEEAASTPDPKLLRGRKVARRGGRKSSKKAG